MLDLNELSNNLKQSIYIFKSFYSSAFKFNIAMLSGDWNIPEKIANLDIMSILKKDIYNKSKEYNITDPDDVSKLKFALNRFDDLCKIEFDKINALYKAFDIAYKTSKLLVEKDKPVILNWFIKSFFEIYLQVVAKAYDVYVNACTAISFNSDLPEKYILASTVESFVKEKEPALKANYYYKLVKYIRELTDEKGYLKVEDYTYLFNIYNRCTNTEDYTKDVNLYIFKYLILQTSTINEEIRNDVKDINEEDNVEKSPEYSVVVAGGNVNEDNNTDNRFNNIINQTIKSVRDNEEDVSFNLTEDFKIYFMNNKDEYNPIFVKRPSMILTIISYNDNHYLLYMKDNDENVYGVSLSNWLSEPNSIIKIEPDEEGKFEFVINDIEVMKDHQNKVYEKLNIDDLYVNNYIDKK